MGREAGNPDPKVMCSYFTGVAHSRDEEQRTKERLLSYLHGFLPAIPQDRSKTPPHIAYFADIADTLKKLTPSDLGERSIVTGDRERCVEILKKCEDGGISEVILYFNFGALSHRDTLAAMERFATEVMPHFTPKEAADPAG